MTQAPLAPPPDEAEQTHRRPRRPMSLQFRLILTVTAIVSLILIVVTSVTGALLGRVLEDRLSEQLNSLVSNSEPWLRTMPPGSDAAEMLNGRPVIAGMLLLLNPSSTETSGAVVAEDGAIERLSDQQLGTLEITLRDPQITTITVPGKGDYRVTGLRTAQGVALVGLPTAEMEQTIGRMVTTVMLATAGGLLLLGIATTVVIRAGLRPLRAVADIAMRVSSQRLDSGSVSIDDRVPAAHADPQTEVGQVGAALNTLLDHVDASLEARQRSVERMRRFVADASHELRTPLASIRGYSELSLRDPGLGENTSQALERIQAQSVRMTALVEDLLLLARLDEGREIAFGVVDLTRLAVEAVADQQAAGPDHEWRVDVGEDPVEIAGDAPRLSQVVINLLANARTHTPEGTQITLTVRREGTASATRAVLAVHDNGPGVDPSLQDELFTRFARGDRSRARQTGGTGLGLSIAKAIVDAHHGTIAVHSVPGDTTFEVRLPAKPAELPEPGPQPNPGEGVPPNPGQTAPPRDGETEAGGQ